MLFGWPWPPRRSTPSAPPRPRCRRRRPESRRPSGHRHSGSGSRCRLFLDPEGDGSFEQITLHPQPGVLALQLPQPRLLITRQPVLVATVDAVLADPVPQGRVVDAKLTGDLGDRPAAAMDQLHRVAFELGSELAPVPWLSVFHAAILRSREVSCLRGEVHSPSGLRTPGQGLALSAPMLRWSCVPEQRRSSRPNQATRPGDPPAAALPPALEPGASRRRIEPMPGRIETAVARGLRIFLRAGRSRLWSSVFYDAAPAACATRTGSSLGACTH